MHYLIKYKKYKIKVWDYALKELGVVPSKCPILFTEKALNSKEDREKIVKVTQYIIFTYILIQIINNKYFRYCLINSMSQPCI